MLQLEIGREIVIEEGKTVRFGFEVEHVLELEHSLATLSKWESIWEKPFIDGGPKSGPEIISYIDCMVQTPESEYPPHLLLQLTKKNLDDVDEYINAKMTATWFNEIDKKGPASSEKLTAELIYYWMSHITSPPPDYQNWHLNKLFTYIKIHDVKNQPKKKVNQQQAIQSRREINERRKAEMGTRG